MNAADNGDFARAIEFFSQILEVSPNHVDALTQMGMCLMNANQDLDSALVLFQRVYEMIPEEQLFSPFGIELQHAKARTYSLMHQPLQSLATLTNIIDSVDNPGLRNELTRDIREARNAILLIKNPVPLRISDLGEIINSEYDDHSPLVSLTGQRIFFTSRRPVGRDRKLFDGQFSEKIYVAEFDGERWREPKVIEELFSPNEHISILSLSSDGKQLFLFKNDRFNGRNIYVSYFRDGIWQEPEMLPHPINTEWDETHASLSPDQSSLYFTSNRPGGYGGLDIYKVTKDEYGKWGEAVNLGPGINTELDEETPMVHPDGETLYFSSQGHLSMGGFDVFYSQKSPDGNWVDAVNMGYPVNSADDDFFFVPSLDKSKAYFASYRFSQNTGRSDIYEVNFDSVESGSLAVVEGVINNEENILPEQIRILVWRESDNLQVGDYRPDPRTGEYMLFLETGERYMIQEATPDKISVGETVHIINEMAFSQSKQVLLKQDLKMSSPLILQRQIADIGSKGEAIFNYSYADSSAEISNEDRDSLKYTIQILALKKSNQAPLWFFSGLDVQMINAYRGKDQYLRYVTGEFECMQDAELYLDEIRKNGKFDDAWIRELPVLNDQSDDNWLVFGD